MSVWRNGENRIQYFNHFYRKKYIFNQLCKITDQFLCKQEDEHIKCK